MAKVGYERVGSAAVLTITRPERRNAVDDETAAELLAGFHRFEADDAARALVLTGEGPEAFCAGADLKAFAERAQGFLEAHPDGGPEELREAAIAEWLDDRPDGPLGFTRLRASKPTIAAISGWCLAGGLELALWCDLRVAAEGAILGVFNRRFGVPLIDLGTIRLPRLIGHSRAMDLLLTGRPVGAAEALAMGLVNRVVPDGAALTAAVALAHELAALPQAGLRNDRLSAIEQWDLAEPEAVANELRRGMATLASGETAAGAASFAAGQGRHGAALPPNSESETR